MVGARVPAELGKGIWVVYHYQQNPSELYYAGPYSEAEATAATKLFRTDPYRAAGFRSPYVVRV